MVRGGEGTKFTIDRKIFTSDIWFASPWKLKIWIYLLGNANHSKGKFMGVEIERGQLIRSYRTIASDCGYKIGYRLKKPSYDTVRRCCEDLTKDKRIVQRSVQYGTLFTILNYNDLQPFNNIRTDQVIVQQSVNDRSIPVQNNNDNNEKHYKKKECIDCREIFDYWNSLGIIKHREIEKFKPYIKAKLENYSVEEIKEAMLNYKKILNSPDHWPSYPWDLAKFLTQKNAFDGYLTENNPFDHFKNFEKSKSGYLTDEEFINGCMEQINQGDKNE